jgi:polyisoprenoid-binding protein YceI
MDRRGPAFWQLAAGMRPGRKEAGLNQPKRAPINHRGFFHVTGDLTMLGVTRPISLDVEVARKLAGTTQRVGFKATGVINRLDFGMNSGYPLISDAIHLTVTTEASAEP